MPEKEGYEPHIPDHLREEYGLTNKQPVPTTMKEWVFLPQMYGRAAKEEEEDPASWITSVKKLEQKKL